jgi:phosphoadenosine phosphosulfate reductase
MKKEENTVILNPKIGFYQWIKINIIPNRFSRGCCRIFKEGETSSYIGNKSTLFFMGMRNDESATRSEYQDEYYNPNWGKMPYQGILPIREWNELEVWLYTMRENININGKYKKGYMRCGCHIACPYYTKSTWILDEYWYPKMYHRWQDILRKDFIDNFKWTRLNCTLEEYKLNWNGGLVRTEPNEEVVNEFAEYKGINPDVARKYFNKNCKCCDKKVKTKDEIAMNLKLLGRNIGEYYCKKHLMELLEIDKERWNELIGEFKVSGCELF